jgi:tetratricopeptide (TPR) repeat protein
VLSCEELVCELEKALDGAVSPLRDVPERHKSFAALFESSWTRLSQEERIVLAKLSILRGSFTRDVAERVAGATIMMLLALVDKSLIQRPLPGRYALHEVIRRYGEVRLREQPGRADSTETARSAYFAAFLKQREDRLKAEDQLTAAEEITREIDNVRAAWNWALATRRDDHLSTAFGALSRFYRMKRWESEGAAAFKLPALTGQLSRIEGQLLGARAEFLSETGAISESRPLYRAAFAILGNPGDEADLIEPLKSIGITALKLGRHRAARRFLERSKRIADARQNSFLVAGAQQALARVMFAVGDLTAAERLLNDSVAVRRQSGDLLGRSVSHSNLADLLLHQGRFTDARRHCEEALAIARPSHNPFIIALPLVNLAEVELAQGNPSRARRLAAEACRYFSEIGRLDGAAACADTLGRIAVEVDDIHDAIFCFRRALTAAATYRATNEIVATINSIAELFRGAGYASWASELFLLVTACPASHALLRLSARSAYEQITGLFAGDFSASPAMEPRELAARPLELLDLFESSERIGSSGRLPT